jgi:hypothetical protein
MGEPIFIQGPAKLAPGERERSIAAYRALQVALRPVAEQFGGIATANALVSIYLELMLRAQGIESTREGLRLLRRDVPRFAAALRAAGAGGGDAGRG